MKKRISLILILSCLLITTSSKAKQLTSLVDTITVYSSAMNSTIRNVVILPNDYYNTQEHFPTVYLLHGYSGSFSTWIKKTKPSLQEEASKLNLIIICPEGKNSWYWDSPINENSKFETYISKELINHIDANYRTVANKKGRAITGFSMGGHGGLWLGINHPDVFGACGSMSGGVDIRPFPNNWETKDLLGEYDKNAELWNKYTVINQIHKIKPNSLAIIIDCGIDDFFYEVNERLHKQLIYSNIPHDYIVRPGGHTHDYWHNAIDYQLLFFKKYFSKK